MTSGAGGEALVLQNARARLSLIPQAGGAVAGWWVDGQSMLRAAGELRGPGYDPYALACFPLVPFSNRIWSGFTWEGQPISLPPNRDSERAAIHGVGWLQPWTIERQSESSATLVHAHPGAPAWPWPYVARQCFTLGEASLDIALSVANLAGIAVPLSIGIHPYFDSARASLRFGAEAIWLAGPDMLPRRRQTPTAGQDFGDGRAIAGTDLDNGYDGWDGTAEIGWAGRALALHLKADLPCAVVYTPRDADFFCFEPVAHSNNAPNLRGEGVPMPVAPPGATIEATIRLRAIPADRLTIDRLRSAPGETMPDLAHSPERTANP